MTIAIRQVHESAGTEAEVKRRSREFIAYTKWRQGWQTMQAYDHYFDAGRHAEVQDEYIGDSSGACRRSYQR